MCGVCTLVTSEDSEEEYSERGDGRREPLPPRPPAAPPRGAAAVAAVAAWPELSSSKLRPTGERGERVGAGAQWWVSDQGRAHEQPRVDGAG